MPVRTKLLLVMMVPLVLLVIQITTINVFIRELQTAGTFISDAHSLIESDFEASETVNSLRASVKRLPSRYVSGVGEGTKPEDPLGPSWLELDNSIKSILSSSAGEAIEPGVLDAVSRAFASATGEYERTKQIIEAGNADLDTLLERAIFIDRSLVVLEQTLDDLAIQVRR